MTCLARPILLIALLNFGAFFWLAIILGGSAGNGYQEGDRYFLGEHGKYREVSPLVFRYSRLHERAVWVTHVFGFVAGALLMLDRSKRFELFTGALLVSLMAVSAIAELLKAAWGPRPLVLAPISLVTAVPVVFCAVAWYRHRVQALRVNDSAGNPSTRSNVPG